MSNISKIKISGTSYDLKDENACNVVELTQAEYDALPASAKTSNSLFVITDAQGADLSNYYTKSETSGATEISTALNAKADTATTYTKTETNTLLGGKADTATTYTKTEVDNAITAATSTKQDTLVSGTNIKTINNTSILGSGNIDIQGGGGSITIDPSLDASSTNPVANSAITTAINSCAHIPVAVLNYKGYLTKVVAGGEGSNNFAIAYTLTEYDGITKSDNNFSFNLYPSFINGKRCVSPSLNNVGSFNLVDTSAITTSISSSSTDAQVPSAKAVHDQLGGMKIVKLTESEYAALVTKDSDTLYVVIPDPSN